MRILNVAEKNDAAKELARIMSRGQVRRKRGLLDLTPMHMFLVPTGLGSHHEKGLCCPGCYSMGNQREGFSKFNKIYEFNNYNILNTNAQMVMTSVSGHLMELEFNQAYRKWSSCSPLELFSAPVVKLVPEDFQKIKRTLEREVRGSQALIIWTDCDREGENIGFEIIEVCTKVNPRIKLYRARFSEITPQSVGRACANLIAPDNLQSEAVDIRMELDLRIGAAFTRFQTLRLQKVFPGVLSEQLISYGSCQFPTLGFVVDRYKQVQQFVPEQFFKIKVTHETPTAKVDFVWKRGKLFLRTPCLILYQMCLEDPTAVVTNTSSRPKSKWRPLPLDTVELEKLASRKLRISAKETMKIAEKLYNQGYISYPRTETNIFPSSLNLVDLVQQQTEDPNWGAFASRVVADGPHPRQGKKTDNAHPPIHPTKYTGNLQGNEKRLYEFIVRHFLACCSKDAVGRESSVDIEIAGEKFTATGLMILERNYLDVYFYDRWSDKTIPVYNQGQQFQPSSIEMVDGTTSPPPLLSEADLIALMEKHGIGTDATHADHIETIKSRSYVGVQADGTFLPGKLGMGLVEGYDLMKFEFSKPRLRAELEADLKRIEDGSKRGPDVLREQIAKYRESFVKAAQEALKLDQALSAYFGNPQAYTEPEIQPQVANPQVRLCPRCRQEQMTLRKTKEGNYMIGCLGFPNCRASIFLPKFVLEATVDDSTCRVCGPDDVHRLRFTFKRGSVPPMLPLQHVGCIGGCDEMLRETLDLRDISNVAQPSRGSSQSTRTSQPARPANSSSDSNGGRGRGRGRGRADRGRGRGRGNKTTTTANRRQNNSFNQTQTNQFDGNSQNSMRPSCFNGGDFGGSGNTWCGNNSRDSGFGSGSSFDSFSSNPTDENAVVCGCGTPATLLTVKKEGPNKGRPFYRCSQRDGSCDFFLWGDDGAPANSASNTAPFGSQPPNRNTTWNSNGSFPTTNSSQGFDDPNQTVCNCNEPAVSRTVKKEGPNQGRQFYACPKPMGQGCSFFQWADQDGVPQGRGFGPPGGRGSRGARGGSSQGRGWTRGNGRGGGASGGRGGKKRKCGQCHQEGHTKKTCPDNK